MNKRFLDVVHSLEPSCQRLLAMTPVTPATLPRSIPKAGIYLFSEGDRHLYVGRTRNIRGRIARQSRPSATHRMAAFAFRLARETTNNLTATYKEKGSRANLMQSPTFRLAFDKAKRRVRAMDLRFVGENDPVRQAVLEIYVALSLETPYNDFDTY